MGVHKKPIDKGELPKKGEAWAVCRFKRKLGKKDGSVFDEGVDTPMYTMKQNKKHGHVIGKNVCENFRETLS